MIKNLTIVIAMIFFVQIFAQKTDSSPYSSFGIGSEVQSKTVEEMSMGGVGTAGNLDRLSFSNPASFALQRVSSYTLSGENRAYWFKDNNGKDNASNAYLSYLAMGIPLGDKAGFAFGLQLNSTMGYTISENEYDSSGELLKAALYEGSGGTNRVFFGLGYEVFKNFSVGVEANYIFGKALKSEIKQTRDIHLATKYKADADISGFALKAGAIYKKQLKNGLLATAGTSIEFENSLDAKTNEYLYSVSISGPESPRDTILNRVTNGNYVTPLKTNIGVSIGNPGKWAASLDYSFRTAIELSGNFVQHNPKGHYENVNMLAVGGFYTPRYNSISSYWERVSYRGGVRFGNTGLLANGNNNGSEFTSIKDYGISFGLGLPVGKRYSMLDTSFEYGVKGTTSNGLTKENYFTFRVGLAFGDKWFGKREIN